MAAAKGREGKYRDFRHIKLLISAIYTDLLRGPQCVYKNTKPAKLKFVNTIIRWYTDLVNLIFKNGKKFKNGCRFLKPFSKNVLKTFLTSENKKTLETFCDEAVL